MLGIRDILVRIRLRIRILRSVLLTNGSECGSGRAENNLHHSSKIKSHKEVTNSRNQGFSYYFCLMMEGSGAGSVLVTNGSGRPKKHTDPQFAYMCANYEQKRRVVNSNFFPSFIAG